METSVMKAVAIAGIGIAAISAIVAAAGYAQVNTPPSPAVAAAIVDDKGNLHVPDGYRTTYESLGGWAVAANEGAGAKEFHVVYASPGTIAAYRRDGRFPEGTVLVKEVFQAATGSFTTGTVSHAETLKGWFVMVKDTSGRYPSNKLWGDGWGWSWFDATDPVKTTSTDYRVNCLACHVPARASDWVYVDGYPPLKK